jgi:hypothetical protein
LNKLVSPVEIADEPVETARFAQDKQKSWLNEGLAELEQSIDIEKLPVIEQRADKNLKARKAKNAKQFYVYKENIKTQTIRKAETLAKPKPYPL